MKTRGRVSYPLRAQRDRGDADRDGDPPEQDGHERADRSPAVLALAWALARDVAPIPKATGDRVAENLDAVDGEIDLSVLDEIDGLEPGDRRIDPDDAAWNR